MKEEVTSATQKKIRGSAILQKRLAGTFFSAAQLKTLLSHLQKLVSFAPALCGVSPFYPSHQLKVFGRKILRRSFMRRVRSVCGHRQTRATPCRPHSSGLVRFNKAGESGTASGMFALAPLVFGVFSRPMSLLLCKENIPLFLSCSFGGSRRKTKHLKIKRG